LQNKLSKKASNLLRCLCEALVALSVINVGYW
jgi:hypothetical protein